MDDLWKMHDKRAEQLEYQKKCELEWWKNEVESLKVKANSEKTKVQDVINNIWNAENKMKAEYENRIKDLIVEIKQLKGQNSQMT